MTIIQHVEHYVTLKQTLGYKFATQERNLRTFASFAEQKGDRYLRKETILEWAAQAQSNKGSINRLRTVRAFAISMHAEDDRHEIPPADTFGRALKRRPVPFLLSRTQIERILEAARHVPPRASITPYTHRCIIGLLAATGMRVSEAVALQMSDITADGLVVRESKFRKSRLVPIHATTRDALKHYLSIRRLIGGPSGHLFVLSTGEPPDHATVSRAFLKLARQTGLRGAPGQRGPRLHDLRHSFASRSLEECPRDKASVDRHMLALSTYLGHACLSDTFWYLEATPEILRKISQVTEAAHQGRNQQ